MDTSLLLVFAVMFVLGVDCNPVPLNEDEGFHLFDVPSASFLRRRRSSELAVAGPRHVEPVWSPSERVEAVGWAAPVERGGDHECGSGRAEGQGDGPKMGVATSVEQAAPVEHDCDSGSVDGQGEGAKVGVVKSVEEVVGRATPIERGEVVVDHKCDRQGDGPKVGVVTSVKQAVGKAAPIEQAGDAKEGKVDHKCDRQGDGAKMGVEKSIEQAVGKAAPIERGVHAGEVQVDHKCNSGCLDKQTVTPKQDILAYEVGQGTKKRPSKIDSFQVVHSLQDIDDSNPGGGGDGDEERRMLPTNGLADALTDDDEHFGVDEKVNKQRPHSRKKVV